MYGPLRMTRGFKSRRKKQRPTSIPAVEVDESGVERATEIPVTLLPTVYIALEFPPPGVLSGAAKSKMNPEMKVHLKGDKAEIERAMRALDVGKFELESTAMWGPFCRLLAKIGHTYAAAMLNGGYEPLLVDVILGKSEYLSHYVGGTTEPVPESDLWLSLVTVEGELYLTVGIVLLGRGRLPPYQVVVGRVTDAERLINESRKWDTSGA
jgi:hypothetical protein